MGRFNEYPRVSLYECRCVNCGWTSLEVLRSRLYEKESSRRERRGGRMLVSASMALRLGVRRGVGRMVQSERRRVGGGDWKGVVGKEGGRRKERKLSKVCPAYKERRLSQDRLSKFFAGFGEVKGLRFVEVGG